MSTDRTTSSLKSQIPNFLSCLRVFLIPIFICLYFLGQENSLFTIFILAAFSDFLDGYLARKWEVCSSFGAFIDPVADKLLVCSALLLIQDYYQSSLLLACNLLIILRELTMSSLRHWSSAQLQLKDIPVSFLGKFKTASQLLAIALLLLSFEFPIFYDSGVYLLTMAAILSVISLISYIRTLYHQIS